MKIAQVIPTYAPAWRYGGPIFAVAALSEALVRRGHDVDVFTTSVDGPFDLDVPTDRPVDRNGVQVHYFPSKRGRRLYYSPPLSRAFREAATDFDVAHLHSVFLWPTSRVARIAVETNLPYLVSPRGMLVRELIEQRSRFAKTLWLRAIESTTLRQAAAVHVTSEIESRELDRFTIDWPHRVLVPNGVTIPSRDDLPIDDARLESLLSDATPTVVVLGRIHEKKGIDRLLRALSSLPDVKVIVAGNDDGHQTMLEKLARELQVERRVHFVGPVYDANRDRMLARADLVAVPSHQENFANVVLEAMAASTPVVATRDVGASEILERYQAGVVVDGDVDAIANGIRSCLANGEARAAMGARGRQAVEQHLTWDRVAEAMEGIYHELTTLASGARPPYFQAANSPSSASPSIRSSS